MLAARDPAPPCDPIDGVDVMLIRWMLSLSLDERLAVLQGFADSVVELTHDSLDQEWLAYARQEAESGFAALDRGEGIRGTVDEHMARIDAAAHSCAAE